MFSLGSSHRFYLYSGHWDMRKSFDGLCGLVSSGMTRDSSAPLPILGNFKGYLQSDGYVVYEKYARSKDITHLACWAHTRREFEKALDNDKSRAEKALLLIQKLYAIERMAKDQQLDTATIKELRLKESLPIINKMGTWIFNE